MKLASYWSLERRFGGAKAVVTTAPIPSNFWIEACNLAQAFPLQSVPITTIESVQIVVLPLKCGISLPTLEEATTLANPILDASTTFENYRVMTSKWCVIRNTSCSCIRFLTHYVCPHVLCCRIYAGESPPPNVIAQPIQQKRKRGRPRKTTQALVRQPEE